MGDKDLLKDIYKYFGEQKDDSHEMYSIANIFYELGNEEKGDGTNEKSENGQ